MEQRDVIKEWVKRLRSGEYQQGRNFLETVGGDGTSRFCCLGVLCRMAVEEGIVVAQRSEFSDRVFFQANSDDFGHDCYLPDAVREWSGVDSINQEQYSIMNDGTDEDEHPRQKTFKDIADRIEQDFAEVLS